jgi:hypothetical protein
MSGGDVENKKRQSGSGGEGGSKKKKEKKKKKKKGSRWQMGVGEVVGRGRKERRKCIFLLFQVAFPDNKITPRTFRDSWASKT